MSSRIYAAEDDDNIREILRCTLESYGYEVEVFESAAPMLERMRQQLPDLVLMDVCTEGGASGLKAVEDIRKSDEEIKIIRSKKFDMKPMYPEDACVQMELLGHDFFVFINAETEDVNVVYKRKGNTYGLIEPEY